MTEPPPAPTTADEPVTPEVPPQRTDGIRLLEQGDYGGALAKLREAQAVQPDDPATLYHVGMALSKLDRFDEAYQALQSCLSRGPRDRALVHNAMGRALERLDRLEEAESCYRQAIDEHFQFYGAHFNLGLLLLSQGRLPEGLFEYEWRWQTSTFHPFRCLQPRWKGRQFDGTLLVHTEQGAGDTMQFCRYLPLIRDRIKRLIFVCPERLQHMFPTPHWADTVLVPGNLDEATFDAYLPLLSAPYVLRTQLDTIPHEVPYLTPEARHIALNDFVGTSKATFKVGIVWGGSPTHTHDQYRSCPLKDWTPVLEVPNVEFYSLQTAPQREQLAALESPQRDRVHDLDDLQNDFSDTAAILKQLDLLITVDTAILHLAGGLALPVWGLLSRVADWRCRCATERIRPGIQRSVSSVSNNSANGTT